MSFSLSRQKCFGHIISLHFRGVISAETLRYSYTNNYEPVALDGSAIVCVLYMWKVPLSVRKTIPQ